MTNKLNAIKFIKILDIAISADICFEGDAEDAKEILDLFNALLARAERAEQMVERLIELGDVINGDKDSVWTLQTIKECWTEDVTKWKERE